MPRLVARVAGVVGIENKLTWREDDTAKPAYAR
jgi:hypothetical protein